MATNTQTDMTEEDAADLQFPKDSQVPSECTNCKTDLKCPYVKCAECPCVNICTICFSKGAEFDSHKNNHSYSVHNDDFHLFPNCDWSARDELTLLEGLKSHRNLEAVVKTIPSRNLKQIKEHYESFYVNRLGNLLLPRFETGSDVVPEDITPYRFKVNDVQDPPRYNPGSAGYSSVAGYNASRSDFEVKYDTNAEDLVVHLPTIHTSDVDYNLMSDLECAITRIYNRRLEERERRRRIIRDHGLIMLRKTTSWLHRYDMTISQKVYDRLVRFMQFYSGENFDKMMEGLHRAGELKIQIARLCDFRKKGISTLEGARLYMHLKQIRENNLKDLRVFHGNPQFKPNVRAMAVTFPSKRRTSFTPLDIIGMPGYDKLQIKERDLCRNVRLVPLTYLELKEILITENNKLGHLKLLTARRLLKIDVNKTRKLYDFLVQEGFVTKPK